MMPPCQRYPASPGVPIRITAWSERLPAVTVISRGTGAGFIASIKAPAGALAAVHDDLGANSTVIVVWDGQGTTTAGTTRHNTYARFMTVSGGMVIDGTAF